MKTLLPGLCFAVSGRPLGWWRLFVMAVLGQSVAPLNAASLLWNAGMGAWTTPANWSPPGPPSAADTAVISNGGTAELTGSNGTANTVEVGSTGTGALRIAGGATLTDVNGAVGIAAGDTGSVNLDGFETTWSNDELTVGVGGTATLVVENGANVAVSNDGIIGRNAGATGTVTIADPGSRWANGEFLTIGYAGAGVLNILRGGIVIAHHAMIGYAPAPAGTLSTVAVDGSTWRVNGSLFVGNDAGGELRITNGASVTNGLCVVGARPGASGDSVLVDGLGSTWTNESEVYFGSQSVGSVTIRNGARMTSGGISSSSIGGFTGISGTVTIDGAGSRWTITREDLSVGEGGAGTLNLQNGGTVTTMGRVFIGRFNLSQGILNIGSAAGNTTGGTFQAASIMFGTGTGRINFNQTDTVNFAVPILGNGTVHQLGSGRTRLSVSSGYTGGTTISAGILEVNNPASTSATGTGPVQVNAGGTLAGNGTIAGDVTVHDGGRISPGSSVGTLSLGDLTLSNGAIYFVELSAPGVGDKLNVTGAVDLLGATLSGTLLNSFVPQPGETFTIISNDGIDPTIGLFAQGALVDFGQASFSIDYASGDGNDVVLTALPEPAAGILVSLGIGLISTRRSS